MKRIVLCCFFALALCMTACGTSYAGHHHGGHHSHHGNHHYSSSSSGSHQAYIISKDYSKTEQKFPNCSKHYMEVETVTYHYSDGTRRSYNNITVFNSDGTILIADCRSVRHVIYENQHYFIIGKNGYFIMNSNGEAVTKRSYSRIDEFKPNRLIVKYDKRYGIIDLKENVIVPIKYQKFIIDGNGIFISKLNGYWGILDENNNILVKHECEKNKSLSDTIMLKRYGKYGLTDLDGKIIFDIKYDKIKKLGEYIVVKEGKKYFALDSDGERINEFSYDKIKLERNTLYGLVENKQWIEIKKVSKQQI